MKDYREMSESVLERRDRYRIRKRRRIKGIMSGAVCFCAAALLGAGLWVQGAGGSDGGRGELGDAREEQKESRLAPVEDLSEDTEKSNQKPDDADAESREPGRADGDTWAKNGSTGEKGGDTGEMNEAGGESQAVGEAGDRNSSELSQGTVVDRPAAENPGSTGSLEAYEAVWGGSYTDEAGRLVILLTEDTAENREKVFQLNPALKENNTIFMAADYSLRYLTDLMEKISQAMVQKEFPNVTSAALREDRNRIVVTMLGEDMESEARLQALDTVGGAIEIAHLSDAQEKIRDYVEGLSSEP
ncbi:MAG: hypothetical protein K2O06_15140 [Acetatifactor sp.]|nr:hypothetical protein [Acetatifactor sp.]